MQAKIFVLVTGTITALTSCEPAVEAPARLTLTIAPLVLPDVTDVCYSLTVFNAPSMTAADIVWTEPEVCASKFGNGAGGDVAFVGTCDANTPAPGDDLNYVRLTLDRVDVAGTEALDFRNPCAAPGGCVQPVACVANADAKVTFDLTVMAGAEQGFFDVAVTFDDIFCSGKYDTCYDTTPGSEVWIDLLHGDDSARDRTGVIALACTVDGPTTLRYSEVALACANGSATTDFTLPLALPAGEHTLAVDWGAPVGLAPLHYATYVGNESFVSFNVAFDLDDIPAGWSCALDAQGTATRGDGPFTDGALSAAGTSYPFIDYQIADVAACQQNPLDGDGSGVTTDYASTFMPSVALQTCYRYDGNGSPQIIPFCAPGQPAELSDPSVPPTVFIGSLLTASSTLTRNGSPVAGELVAFELAGPGPSILGATTDANGVATVSFSLTAPGPHTVTAHFEDNASGASATTIYQPTALALASAAGPAGAPITLSAGLRTLPTNAPLANQTVVFSFAGDAPDQSATTDANGVATVAVTFADEGTYDATATFMNAAGFYADSTGAFPLVPEVASAIVSVGPAAPLDQRTKLTLSPIANVSAGVATTVTATLVTLSDDAPLAGQTITFTFSGDVSPRTATTSSDGRASVSVTFVNSGSYTVTATYDPTAGYLDHTGSVPPIPEVDSIEAQVLDALTTLSTPSVPSGHLIGNSLSASATLVRTTPPSGPLGGRTLTFTLDGPGGPVVQTATTDGNGTATTSFAPSLRGAYNVRAQFAGAAGLQAATSSDANVEVYQRATLLVNHADGVAGDPVTVSAQLVTFPDSTPIAGVTIDFDFFGVVASGSGVTDSNGIASIVVTFPNPGSFATQVTVNEPFITDPSGALPALPLTSDDSVSVMAVTTSLTAPTLPATPVGVNVQVSTTLTRLTLPSGPLVGRDVTFTFTGPSGTSQIIATTDSNGNATVTYTPTAPGLHDVALRYDGDAARLPASTSTTFTVQ